MKTLNKNETNGAGRTAAVRGENRSLRQLFVLSSGRTLGPMLAAQSAWTLYQGGVSPDSTYLAILGLIVGAGVGLISWQKSTLVSRPVTKQIETQKPKHQHASKPG